MTSTPSPYPARLAKLQGLIRQNNLTAMAIVPGANLFYLTGLPFQTASRPMILIVPAEGTPGLIIPSLEVPRAEGRTPFPITFFPYTDAEGYAVGYAAASAALRLAGGRIGVEGMKMRVLEGNLLAEHAANARIEPAEDWLMWLRMHKDQAELAAMREAIRISEAALERTLTAFRPGQTERHIARTLQAALDDLGSTENAFDAAILSGPNSALPHGGPSERAANPGDLLLFDFGGRFGGYAADITRVFAVGSLSAELEKIYQTVLAANLAAIAAVRPGIAAQEVDRAARKVITDAGYGEYFIHRTGHGLGLDIHEAPYMREGNPMLLEPGMVFTIEPGIYVQGLGGVRIEDDIVVTETGGEVLTTFPKALRTL